MTDVVVYKLQRPIVVDDQERTHLTFDFAAFSALHLRLANQHCGEAALTDAAFMMTCAALELAGVPAKKYDTLHFFDAIGIAKLVGDRFPQSLTSAQEVDAKVVAEETPAV
jgi:hypothetical protein